MDLLSNISWGLILPILVVQLILIIVALIDLSKVSETNGPKWVWAIVIIIFNIVGPILYFVVGRKQA
jgi:hypothetical protein